MIKKIRKERITVCIPTMNRTKLLTRFIKYYIKNCNMKTDFVLINSNVDKIAVDENIKNMIEESGNTFIDHYTPPNTVGEARKIGFDIAKDLGNEYVLTGDDDSRIGKLAIEKMLAPLFCDDRFWKIGHLGGYRCFMRDFKSNEVRFHAIIGVLWATKLSVIEQIGNIDPALTSREDNEWGARIWHHGGWTAIVDADVKHTRHQPLEFGQRTIPENYTEGWMTACKLIEERYPKIFKNRDGKLYKQFEYPDIKFNLSDELKLESEDSKQKSLFDA